ncbi:MAG: MFS transporter [Janthinobacterium lividum]
MRKPLLALTAAAFGIGTSEFIIVGLLPTLARDFAISIPLAGTLVTAYALSVTFGSPFVALALGRVDRKRSLLFLMGLFALGNTCCALAPGFHLLLAARILTALCHGAFFGIGSVVAVDLVPREERAQAIALMFTGLTLANILGVPAGTALGLHFGWRATFWALVPIGILAIVALWRLLPYQPSQPTLLRQELRAVLRPPVLLVLLLSTLSSVSLFCVLTYIAPMLEAITHLAPGTVTWVLVLFGAGITVGNLLGGRLSDWRQMTAILGGYGALALVLFAMPFTLRHAVPAMIAVFFWGLVHFAAGAPLQPRVVEKANGANLAATLNQSAFNLGNALGASLGGLLLTRGVGYGTLPTVAGAVAAVTVLVGCLTLFVEQRERRLTNLEVTTS